MGKLKGNTIVAIRTIGSMYSNQCIILTDNKGTEYRLKVEELLPLINEVTFNVKKKIKHSYLTIKN